MPGGLEIVISRLWDRHSNHFADTTAQLKTDFKYIQALKQETLFPDLCSLNLNFGFPLKISYDKKASRIPAPF